MLVYNTLGVSSLPGAVRGWGGGKLSSVSLWLQTAASVGQRLQPLGPLIVCETLKKVRVAFSRNMHIRIQLCTCFRTLGDCPTPPQCVYVEETPDLVGDS